MTINSEKSVQYGHVTIGNTPGIDTESQYTMYTVTRKTYIQARRHRVVTGPKPLGKEPQNLMGLRLANFQAAMQTLQTLVCFCVRLIVILYHQSLKWSLSCSELLVVGTWPEPLKCQEKPSGVYKMQENAMSAGVPHQTPLGSLKRSP